MNNFLKDKIPRPSPVRPFPFPFPPSTDPVKPEGSVKPGEAGALNPGEVKPGGPDWVDKPLLPSEIKSTESVQLSPDAHQQDTPANSGLLKGLEANFG